MLGQGVPDMKRSGSPLALSDSKSARTASASAASACAVAAVAAVAPEDEESESYSNALAALNSVDVSVEDSVESFNRAYDAALGASALRQVRPDYPTRGEREELAAWRAETSPRDVQTQVTGTLAIASSTTACTNAETGWHDIAERVVSHLDTSLGGQFFTPRFVRADVLAARAHAGRRLEVRGHSPKTLPRQVELPPKAGHPCQTCWRFADEKRTDDNLPECAQIVHHLMREILADCVEAAKSNALEMPTDGSWRELRTYASFQEYMAPPATITPRTKLFHLFRPLPLVWALRDSQTSMRWDSAPVAGKNQKNVAMHRTLNAGESWGCGRSGPAPGAAGGGARRRRRRGRRSEGTAAHGTAELPPPSRARPGADGHDAQRACAGGGDGQAGLHGVIRLLE